MTLLDKINALEASNDTLAYWSPRYGKWMPGLTISEVRAMAEALERLLFAANEVAYAADDSVTPWGALKDAIEHAEALQEAK